MKKFRVLISKLMLVLFVISNVFACTPSFSFAAKGEKKEKVNYAARAKSEIIVKYKDSKKSDSMQSSVKGKLKLSKLERKERFGRQKIDILEIGEKDDRDKVLKELRSNPNVEYAQPNYKLEIATYTAPPGSRFSEQWGLYNNGQSIEGQVGRSGVDVNSITAWDRTRGSSSVVVGVLDTGIDINHQDLVGNIYVNTAEKNGSAGVDDDGNGYVDDLNGWDFANDDNSVYDSSLADRHGTYTAGIIAANTTGTGIIGVAPNIKILPLKFINSEAGYTCDAIKAIEYAMDKGVKVINCSFGGTDNNYALKDTMVNSGILFVCAAGNRGGNVSEQPFYPSCFNIPNVLSVASIDGNGILAPFSSYGDIIHVAAPGVNILSTTPENTYDYFSGTSASAPFVSGVAALVKSYVPDSTFTSIADRIKTNVVSCSALQGKLTTGGRVDANAAMTNVKPAEDRYNGPGQKVDTIQAGNQGGDIDTWYAQDQLAKIRERLHYGENGVSPASGNYSLSINDMSIPAPGFQININRTYNSRDEKSAPLGRGWTFGFEGSVRGTEVNGNNVTEVTLPSGAMQRFRNTVTTTGSSFVAEDSRSTLTKDSNGFYILTTKDQYTYGFKASGWLTWMKDRNGNTVNITVDDNGKISEITDTVGRKYTIHYTGNLIDTISDVQGRTIIYTYEGNQLKTVTDPTGSKTNYYYDAYGFMESIKDHENQQIVFLTYNHAVGENQHKVAEATDASGHKSNYAYDVPNKKTTVTDANGRSWSYWFDNEMYTKQTQDPEGKSTYTEYKLYGGKNKFGDILSTTDRNGNKIQYDLDDRGNVTKIINPDESYKTFAYDEKNNVITEKDELGKRTDYVYDSNKINLLKKANALDGTSAYIIDGTSSPSALAITSSGAFAVTAYAYYTSSQALSLFSCNVSGLLKSVTDPANHTITYKYDNYGNVTEESDKYDQNGNVVTESGLQYNTTTSSFSAIGWKMYTISPGGHRTDYTYDKNGQLEKSVLDGDETTRIVYDSVGRKIKEIAPKQYNSELDDLTNHKYNADAGYRYTYYNSGKVKTATDPLNFTTTYKYDIYDNLTEVINPTGSAICYEYDNMDRVSKEYYREAEGSTKLILKEYSYSVLADKRTQKTEKKYLNDTETAETVYVYDYANRLVEQQNPDLTRIKTKYNPNGTVESTTATNGSTTKYLYDGLNRLSEQWTPFDVINGNTYYAYSRIEYDSAGKTLKEIKGADSVLLDTIPTDLYKVSYTYYKNGLKKTATDNEGRKTEYFYDEDLNVSKENKYTTDTEYLSTEYVYNHLNKVEGKKVHVRIGDLAGNHFDNAGDTVLTTQYGYDKNGNLENVTEPGIIVTKYEYDEMNRLLKTSQPGVDETGIPRQISVSTKYDWEGKAIEKTDALGKTAYYEYNKRGFLTKVKDAMGGISAYDYDVSGRKIAEVTPENYSEGKPISQMNRSEFIYDKMDRLKAKKEIYTDIKSVLHDYYSKAFLYDNSGNAVKELDAGGLEAGSGTTLDEKINSGYGTEYTFNYANLGTSKLDAVSKERALPYTVKYKYDGMGRKVSETSANGAVTNYGYDFAGNLLYVKIAKTAGSLFNQILANTYDKAGRQLTQTDGNGNTTITEYNTFTKARTIAYPGDNDTIPASTVAFQYDVRGNLKSQSDSMGKVVLYTYDNQNRVLTQTEMKSDNTEVITQQAIKYDLNGNKRFVTDGRNNTTENIYDDLNRLKTSSLMVHDVVHTNTYEYDKNGNQKKVTDWLGNTTENVYDPLGRLIQKKDANQVVIQEIEYNNSNIQVKSYDALHNATSYEYDRNNRLLATIDPEQHRTSQYYDDVGNIRTKVDAKNNTLTYSYNELNRLVDVTNSRSEKTSYTYDLNGNMLTQKDGRGYVTSYEYNVADKMIRKINDGGRIGTLNNYTYLEDMVESYKYYPDGNLKSKTDRNGKTTNYDYDIHGRILSETISSSAISYTYDGNGNQLTMTDGTGTTERTYDELNRVLTKTVPNFGTTVFTYDIVTGVQPGSVKEMTTDFKGNVTEKITDKVGRLKYVIANNQTTEYGYYADGSHQFVLYPNGAREDYTYYTDGLLKTLINKNTNESIIDNYSYTYDSAHNQESKSDSKGTTYYTYDSLNRLDSVSEPNGKRTSYMYDESGNRISEYVSMGGTGTNTVYAYDEQNRLKTSKEQSNGLTKITSYEYDPNGNLVSKAQSTIQPAVAGSIAGFDMAKAGSYANNDASFYEYDDRNQLIKAVDSSNTASYKYNGEGLRVEKTGTSMKTLLSDNFGGLENWINSNNATITNGQLKVTNNDIIRSASGSTTQWKDFVLEVDVKIANTNAGIVFRSADNSNYYYWQLSTLSGGKLRPHKVVNGTDTTIKDVATPIAANVWYHVKIQTSGSAITTYIDGTLADTTTDSTFAGGKTGFRESGTDAAVFDNYCLINTGASSKTLTRYLYEGDKVILETDANGNQTGRNVYGTNLLVRQADSETLYYMYNGHADVTALLDNTGVVKASYYYDAFGNIMDQTGNANNNITYAGYQYDTETGLYYLNARYYDSKIARFLSEDTYTGDPNDPLSLNLYTYCHNEPITYTDPTGHWEVGDSDRSTAAQAQILDATKAYIEAKAKGDTEGMADARQKAQDARSGNIYQDNSRVSSTSIASELSAVLSSNYVSQAARNDAKSSDVGFVGSTSSSRDPEIRQERNNIVNTINQARKDTNNVNSNTSVSLSLDEIYRCSFSVGLYSNMNKQNADKNILSRITPRLLFESQYAPSSQQTFLIARDIFGEEAYQALLERDKQYNHNALGTLGYFSDVADAGDGLLYALEGDFANAKWSLGAMIPFVGSAIKPVKKIVQGSSEIKRVVIDGREIVTGSYKQMQKAKLKDAHHIYQDAAVNSLKGYSKNDALTVQLVGPPNKIGTPHYEATLAQNALDGGTLSAERSIAYKSLRKAGFTVDQAKYLVREADNYFSDLGHTLSSKTNMPGNRR